MSTANTRHCAPTHQGPWTHTPRRPREPQPGHEDQHWFDSARNYIVSTALTPYSDDGARVMRWATRDVANLRLNVETGTMSAELSMDLTPAALRELAQRLLDAAHDIDTHPASQWSVKEAA